MRKLFILTILLGLCAYNKVTVVEQHAEPLYTLDGSTYARLHVISSGADSPQGYLTLRKTNNHGWLITDGERFFTAKKKDQKEEL